MHKIWLIVVALSQAVSAAAGISWSYDGDDGPATWSKSYPTCGGNEQSPIDLTTCTNQTYSNFSGGAVGVATSVVNMTLQNNGHSVSLTSPNVVTVSGGCLNGTYYMSGVHFHWGNTSTRGSEHTVNGKAYPMSMHMVTYKTSFANLAAALNSSDREAVAVLGVFAQVQPINSTSSTVDAIVSALPNIYYPGNSTVVSLPLINLAQALKNIVSTSGFYHYLGSLTTPGCEQKVKWIVFMDAISMTENQLNAFRGLRNPEGQPLVGNFRPIQSLNNRTVYCSIPSTSMPLGGSASAVCRGSGLLHLALAAAMLLQTPRALWA